MDVCVRTFSDEVGASLARMQLQHAGIRSWIVEQVGGVDPAMNLALGVRLMVAESDAARAEEVLSARAEEQEEDDESADAAAVRCPRCEGEYCYRGKPRLMGVSPGVAGPLVAVAALAGVLFGRVRWRCETCGHVWDDASEGPKKRTLLPPGSPRPTFRMMRARGGTGFFLGGLVGFLGGALAGGGGLVVPLGLAGMIAGTLIGSVFKHGVCSTPDCREALPPGIEVCPKCRGIVSGTVRSTAEHFAKTASVRRELAAALAAEEEEAAKSPPRKTRAKTKKGKRPKLSGGAE